MKVLKGAIVLALFLGSTDAIVSTWQNMLFDGKFTPKLLYIAPGKRKWMRGLEWMDESEPDSQIHFFNNPHSLT